MIEMIDKEKIYNGINKGILEERYIAFKKNLIKNLEYIKRYGGLSRIIPAFRDKNIIIIGAGPSIGKELNSLKKFQNRDEIIIISTDMALKPLIKHGIEPGYVISCETTPFDCFSGCKTESMRLLAFSCMSNVNLRLWKGDISFYNWMISAPLYDELWKEAGDLGFVATASIVTTQAVSIALGCDIQSLALIGNDLGYRTEYYTKETISFNKNLRLSNRVKTAETSELNIIRKNREYKINRGDRVYYTNNQFLAARAWLEDLFKKIDIPIYDISEPGCSEQFVEKVNLKKYLSKFGRRANKKRR